MKDPKVYLAEDFLDEEFKNPPFLVNPIIPLGGIGLIHGKRGHGKSQLAFTMARDIINGRLFLDRHQTMYGRVTYIGLDMPLQQVQARIADFEHEVEHLERLQIAVTTDPINIPDLYVKQKRPQWVEDICLFEPDLIIMDTLRKCHLLGDKDDRGAAFVYGGVRYLFGDHPTVMFPHHDRKSYMDNKGMPEEEQAVGSGNWVDSADFAIHVKKRHQTVTVSFPRVRFSDEISPITCEFDPKTILIRVKQGKRTSYDRAAELKAKDPEMDKREIIAALEDMGVSESQAHLAAKRVL
jgi:RecA-family ATPase